MSDYYLLWFQLDEEDRYLIWITHEVDKDRIATNSADKVLVFSTPQKALQYADQQGWKIDLESPVLYDLDYVKDWLEQPDPDDVDCVEFLHAWNLFNDVAYSLSLIQPEGNDFIAGTELTNLVYDKLFWGNNLPSVTPEGKEYIPIWPAEHVEELKRVLDAGLKMFREHIQIVS